VSAIVSLLAEYPAHIQEKICDLRYGVPSKTSFLPTPKDITDIGEFLVKDERESIAYAKRFSGRVSIHTPSKPYRPFPQLWAHFGDEVMDGIVHKGADFETLDAACRALIVEGQYVAMSRLGIPTHQEGKAA